MKFGVGTSIKNAEIVAAAGFDYLEIFAADNLALSIPEETWRENLRRIKDAPLPVLAMAAILPATVQLVGDGVDMAANVSYMERLLDRAAAAGMGAPVNAQTGLARPLRRPALQPRLEPAPRRITRPRLMTTRRANPRSATTLFRKSVTLSSDETRAPRPNRGPSKRSTFARWNAP